MSDLSVMAEAMRPPAASPTDIPVTSFTAPYAVLSTSSQRGRFLSLQRVLPSGAELWFYSAVVRGTQVASGTEIARCERLSAWTEWPATLLTSQSRCASRPTCTWY